MNWARIEELFQSALDLEPDQRARFLEQQAKGDTALLTEVRSLIASYEAQERAASATPPPQPAGQRFGPYEAGRLLGRGGMGTVWSAQRVDGQFEQAVALKVISAPLAGELFRQRFLLERQILAGLNHPNITRLQDGGVSESGEPYLVMEYVEGVRIDRYCADHRMGHRGKLRLMLKVLSAVDYAHRHLVIHRDLKPDNILVQEDGEPKLLDFGTAKLLADVPAGTEMTEAGFRAFTPEYASPEQVLGQTVTTASDVYSLGVLLYRVLTGKGPYRMRDHSTGEVVKAVCDTEAPPPSTIGGHKELAGDVDAILLRCLRKEPTARYSSVEALAADIRAYLEGRPVSARQGNWQYLTAKFLRRNRNAAAAGVLALASIVAGVIGVAWQAQLARQQRDRAESRLNEIHRLSNSLLFELNDVVKQLPGSTQAQKMIVSKALDHLDRIARDSGENTELQLDLAQAYLKLGAIQGDPYEQNLGEPDGALKSFAKALVLAESGVTSPRAARLAAKAKQAQGEVLFARGDTVDGVRYAREACASLETLSRASKSVGELADAATCFDSLSDQYGAEGAASLSDLDAALAAERRSLELQQEALKIDPQFARSRRGVAIGEMKMGRLLATTDPGRAIPHFRRSLDLLDHLPEAEQGSLSLRRTRAFVVSHYGRALKAGGDYAGAMAKFEEALAIAEPMALVDPDNARAQRDVAVLYNRLGETAEQQGNERDALRYYDKVKAILRPVRAKDPSNELLAAEIGEVTIRMARLGSSEGGVTEALLAVKAVAERRSATPIDLDRAANLLTWLPHPSERFSTLAVSFAERLVEATRGRRADALLTLTKAYRADGQPDKAAATARRGLAQLPEGVPSVLRKQLLAEASAPSRAGAY